MAPEDADEQQQLPPQVTMGLLNYLTAHSLDEGYEEAARRGDRTTDPTGRKPMGLVAGVVIAVFALLVITAAVQTSRNAVSDDRERRDLVSQINTRKANLASDRDRLSSLRITTSRLETELISSDRRATGTLNQIKRLSLGSGASAVRGPGVKVVVNDAPDAARNARNKVLDIDLQKLANGLWQAGAEAISINGERLTNLSAIRHAGDAITVNFKSLSPPYSVLVIGDPDTLPAKFADTTSGQAWLDLQREIHLEFDMTTKESLTLPAARSTQLRYAEQAGGGK